MKTRSRALHSYLLQQGVLNGTNEAIALAKAVYRRLYKRQWRRRQRPRKEIRFEVTLRQFQAIQMRAMAAGMRHTTYAKSLALQSIGEPPPDDRLLEMLQLISMAAIASSHNPSARRAHELLAKAETLLLTYLKRPQHGQETKG